MKHSRPTESESEHSRKKRRANADRATDADGQIHNSELPCVCVCVYCLYNESTHRMRYGHTLAEMPEGGDVGVHTNMHARAPDPIACRPFVILLIRNLLSSPKCRLWKSVTHAS